MPTRQRRCFGFRYSLLATRYSLLAARNPKPVGLKRRPTISVLDLDPPVGRYLCRHANGAVLIFATRSS